MGRELNRPENWSKSLMTFSKRKSNLIKKARKMSASCNIDIAVVAFSPADRLNIFCSKDRKKEEKHQSSLSTSDPTSDPTSTPTPKHWRGRVDHEPLTTSLVKGDGRGTPSNLAPSTPLLKRRSMHLEQLVRRSEIELEVMEASLREYEPDQKHEPSPAELLCCEDNLKRSLCLVTEKKYQMDVETQYVRRPFLYSYNCGLNELLLGAQRQTGNPHCVQHHNWIIDSNSFHGSVVKASGSHRMNLSIPGFPVSPFQSNLTTQHNHYLAAMPLPQFPAIGGNTSSYPDPNFILPPHYELSTATVSESQNIPHNTAATGNEVQLPAHLNHQANPTTDEGPGNLDVPDPLSTEAMLADVASPSLDGAVDQEGISSWELDGYALAEDLTNLDDIEIVFQT
ncbi:hypothetical protein CRG98_003290 [Punica granatum]|uniref:MADS-box domain-containing protein n=1 Tax=Punica granatum TaxID=22663 RepID=A0A2I0L6N9_PUNGR|nr:hypothetical protein CRG98_003290 [Punica granatum]